MVNLVLKWVKEQGGVQVMEKRNIEKSGLIYDAIDASGGFYQGNIDKDSRSIMNVTFRLPSEELEKKFVKESEQRQLRRFGRSPRCRRNPGVGVQRRSLRSL